jgi:hypothetical protein
MTLFLVIRTQQTIHKKAVYYFLRDRLTVLEPISRDGASERAENLQGCDYANRERIDTTHARFILLPFDALQETEAP